MLTLTGESHLLGIGLVYGPVPDIYKPFMRGLCSIVGFKLPYYAIVFDQNAIIRHLGRELQNLTCPTAV
jgi:hypothetical protein